MKTTNNQPTSATSANLPLNVVTNNAKAEAKAQAKEQRKQESEARQKAKKATAYLCKELAKAHNTFFAMIRTALEVADYEVNNYTNFSKEEQKAVASMLRLLCDICTEKGLPTKQQVAEAVNKYASYTHDGEAVKRLRKAKGVYAFEKYVVFSFDLLKEATHNVITHKSRYNVPALNAYYNAKGEVIAEAEALAIIEAEAQAKEQAKAKAEAEALALQRDAQRWRKQAEAEEQAKAEANKAKRESQKAKRNASK